MISKSFNYDWQVALKKGNFGMAAPGQEQAVTLPHDAMIGTERRADVIGTNKKGFFENGTWEYRKRFFVAEDERWKKICFAFDGVYQRAMVYINGDFAGQQPYGYSGFIIEADRYLRYGVENEIKVIARTADDSRWYTGAGIYQNVYLLTADLVHIIPHGVKITTPEVWEKQAAVSVETIIRNDAADAAVTVRVVTEIIGDADNVVACDNAPITVFRGEQATLRQRVYVRDPKLWDVDHPSLYRCKTTLYGSDGSVLEESAESFGIRTLGLDYENGLILNGEPVKLRGSCIHHDNGPIGAVVIARAEERRIEKLKEAGFNAIRMSHHPASPVLLAACDKLGMLVMDEAFDIWTENKSDYDYALDFPTWWEKDIEAMVRKDFNHPSVILYSIGNEIQDTGSAVGSAWGRKISEKIRALDPTRYTTNGINGMVSVKDLFLAMRDKAKEKARRRQNTEINTMMTNLGESMKEVMAMDAVTQATEESLACVDIAGYNYMDSRYDMDRERFPNRIICGTETFPVDIDRNWRKVLDNGNIIGDFTWTGWDYLGEAGLGKITYSANGGMGVYASYPTLTAMCGDIDITGYRRPVSYFREIVFGLRSAPYIAVQRPEHYHDAPALTMWSFSDAVSSWSWKGLEGKPVKVEVYSDADEVELLRNGKSLDRQPTGELNRFKTIFDTVYEPGELTAIAYQNGIETGRHSLQSASGDIRLKLQADRDTLQNSGSDLAYVTIELVDGNGNLFTSDNRKIGIALEGPGQLLGFGTADPDTEENFFDVQRSTFDGRALAVIRPTGNGEITVTATADGMTDAVLELLVQ